MAEDDRSALAQLLPLLIAARMGGGQQGGGPQLGGLQAVQSQDAVAPAQQQASVGSLLGTLPAAPQRDPFFAPSGPNINFFGGSPFPAQDKTRQVLASLVLGSRVLEVAQAARKGKAKGTPKGGTSNG
jgi:hypothetical protein